MATTFAIENRKTLRKAPDVLNITVKDPDSGTTVLSFTREDIISCTLALKGVETKLDNPELQASTIEFEAFYTGSDTDLLAIRGKDAIIEYQSGYSDGDMSKLRTFYATFDSDGISLSRHVLRIKGTDKVGTITGEHPGKVVEYPSADYYASGGKPYVSPLSALMENYEYEVLKLFKPGMESPVSQSVHAYPRPYEYSNIPHLRMTAPNFIDNNKNLILIDSKSRRKLVAELCNVFRGCDPDDPEYYAKRFIFRDAGRPLVRWTNNAIEPWEVPYYNPDPMNTWELDYDDLTDVTVDYGNPVKHVSMNNPGLSFGDHYNSEPVTFDRAGSVFLNFDKPISTGGVSYDVRGDFTVTMTSLSPRSIKLTATGSGNPTTVRVSLRDVNQLLDGSETEPTISISTGLSAGDEITLETFMGLHSFTGTYDGVTYTGLSVLEKALVRAVLDCGLKQPRWINFEWRGHPDMMPRDIILLTEKDGTKNYYEIDNLTLEHKDGGLTSKVKAIYKCPYTGA